LKEVRCDVVVVGSGAGGGTVAQALIPVVEGGGRVIVLEKGPRFRDEEFTGRELEMAPALYEAGGGFLTADGTMTLAFGRAYGGSTVVYTGTSLVAPERVIRRWSVPGLEHDDVRRRSRRYMEENHVHLLEEEEINENNRLFVEGCRRAGHEAEQFPVNVRGCMGSSLCNLGCPNQAKMGTNRVQLPRAEAAGVEVVTRAEATRIEERAVRVRVREKGEEEKGESPEWEPGTYRVEARVVVVAGGPMGTVPLLLRSGFGDRLPALGRGFTCHPAFILAALHPEPISNDVGHPKSYYLDRAEEEGYVLETCWYFPFTTAKNLTGFGPPHEEMMDGYRRMQQILVLACDERVPENRIEADRRGRPVVRYRFTEAVIGRLTAAARTSAEIFFEAGAERVHSPLADPPVLGRRERYSLGERIRAEHFVPGKTSVSAAHLMGGCAMGRGPRDSVTDARGRVHGAPWLRVADASLFPDSVEINPYLTVMALADRTAEGVLEELGG